MQIRKCVDGKSILTCGHFEIYPFALIHKYVPVQSERRKILDDVNKSR